MNPAAAERPRPEQWVEALVQARERMAHAAEIVVEGTLRRMVGLTLEAVGCEAAVGGGCLVDTAEGKQIEAEVVGFSGDKLFLMPTGDIRGVMQGARVIRRTACRPCSWATGCWGGCWTEPDGLSTASATSSARSACR